MVVEREFISCETRGTDVYSVSSSHLSVFLSNCVKSKKKKSNSMFFFQSACFHVLNFHFPSVCWRALRFSASPLSPQGSKSGRKIKFIFSNCFL